MKKSRLIFAVTMAMALVFLAAGALAADVFRFDDKTINLFEGETAQPILLREGAPAEEGTITWQAANQKAVTVSADGTITAVKKGTSTVKAILKNGKKSWSAAITVNVLRAVTDVTLSTAKMTVYHPEDAAVSGLLRQETENDIIVIPAGRSIELKATCTPSDASSRRATFTSSDEGILKISKDSARAMQAGECELTIASAQNPEVREVYHILVTQPATKVTVSSPEGNTVSAGEKMTLSASIEPANASIRKVIWSTRNAQIATVDQDGTVTGIKKGTVIITATAADGSGKSGTFQVTVAQKVTGITIKESGLKLATNQQGYLHATVSPASANDKNVIWSSSDSSIATVTSAGQVKGIKRGECSIIATSRSNPSVSAAVPVQVIQKVTGITFGPPVSLPVRTTAQLTWTVSPADASIQEVTFASSNRKVATVDQNGVVTGIARGSANITATATDGSGRRGTIRVTVTQPVEGVSIQYHTYHIQLDGSLNVKALISPSNANNLNVHFTIEDGYIASVKDNKNIGRVRGLHTGTTTITGVTEDGGYSASAEIRVADFNRAVVVDDLYMEGDNIRIVLRNRGDFPVDRVYFTVETYDGNGHPLVCNTDGDSNSFQGSYRLELDPDERTEHYKFDFGDYVQPVDPIGTVTIKITGWRDLEGYTRNIPEGEYPSQSYHRFIPNWPKE